MWPYRSNQEDLVKLVLPMQNHTHTYTHFIKIGENGSVVSCSQHDQMWGTDSAGRPSSLWTEKAPILCL